MKKHRLHIIYIVIIICLFSIFVLTNFTWIEKTLSNVTKNFSSEVVKYEKNENVLTVDDIWKQNVEAIANEDEPSLEDKAKEGDIEAQFNLGWMYSNGEGVPLDYNEAVKWYRKAAEQGNADAQYNLGLMYYKGEGVAQDYKEAAKWYRKAAEQGDASAQTTLGFMYYNGEDVTQDYNEAVEWYRKAAEQGNALAQFLIGLMYYKGEGVAQDYNEAVEWCRKAAEQGNAFAQYNLGLMYYNGKGVSRDYKEAIKWYRKAADQGYASAQFLIGLMYYKSEGVPEDYNEAAKWHRKAAEQGDSDAQCFLGVIYAAGQGVPENYIEAYKWCILSVAGGNSKAKEIIPELREELTKEQIVEAQRLASAFRVKKTPSNTDYNESKAPDKQELKCNGTGFFITSDGFLLTAYHVIEEANSIEVLTSNGKFSAKLIDGDSINDIAVLKVAGNFSNLPIASIQNVHLGDSIFTIGFPNVALQGLNPKLTKGNINSLGGIQDDPRCFQISVSVQPGNSGGALIDSSGNVVGMLVARLGDIETLQLTGMLPQNINYALKSSYISAFIEGIPGISTKLKEPYNHSNGKFENIVNDVENSTVMVLVY